MTVLSAAIKAIPDDIVEAARLDGVDGLQDVPLHHRAEHPARRSSWCSPRSRIAHAEGLRHRPDDDRRQLQHQRHRQRDLHAELPRGQPGPRCGARRAAVHPGHPDRRLQRPPDAASRRHDEHRAPAGDRTPGDARRSPSDGGRRSRRKKLDLPVGVAGVAIVIAVLWTIPTFGLLVTSFRPEDDIKTTGWWTFFTQPERHARELPRRAAAAATADARRPTSSTRSSSPSRR